MDLNIFSVWNMKALWGKGGTGPLLRVSEAVIRSNWMVGRRLLEKRSFSTVWQQLINEEAKLLSCLTRESTILTEPIPTRET
jgi:hypothetical protein